MDLLINAYIPEEIADAIVLEQFIVQELNGVVNGVDATKPVIQAPCRVIFHYLKPTLQRITCLVDYTGSSDKMIKRSHEGQ